MADIEINGPDPITTTVKMESQLPIPSMSLLVTASGRIDVSGGDGIISRYPVNFADVTVNGTVSSSMNGVYLLVGKLTVGSGASVSGSTGFLCVNESEVVNNGTLSGTRSGIESGRSLKLDNTGIINSSEGSGVYCPSYFPSAEGYQIVNSGTIRGKYEAILVSADRTYGTINRAFITNNGVLESQSATTVKTGDADDTYNARGGGRATGFIDLGNGNNTGYGGSFDDKFIIGSGNDEIDGGGGFDTVTFSTNANLTVNLNIAERQTTGAGNDLLINVEGLIGGSGADKFIGNDSANRLVGGGGNDTLIGGKGNDTLEGGAGTNVAEFSGAFSEYEIRQQADGSILVHDRVDGRDGDDILIGIRQVFFNGQAQNLNANPVGLALSATAFDETFVVGRTLATISALDSDGDALTYSLVSDAGGMFRIANDKLVLNRAFDYETAKQHSVTVKVTDTYGGETTQTFTIEVRNVVEGNPLTLIGTGGADQLAGEAGNDKIYGKLGNDTLTGGSGQDIFVFDTKPHKTKNVDKLADFSVADDTIYLENKYFKVGSGTISKPQKMASKHFYKGTKAHDGDDRIIYDSKKGVIYYDADGTGASAQVKIATIEKKLKLAAGDFYVI